MFWKKLQQNKEILFVILLFTAIYSLTLSAAGDLWWDAAVYIGMAKYIFSHGTIGLWEPNRPLLWPLILGFFWKIGIDIFLSAKIVTIFFSLGTIWLTYEMTEACINKKTAVIAAFLLGFWPVFFLYVSVLQTEIPATFFFLAGLHTFLKKKYTQSGFLLALSFLARFFQFFLIIPILLFLTLQVIQKKEKASSILNWSLAFIIPLFLFFGVNFLLYGNAIYPFEMQSYMTKYTGWVFEQPWWYYFVALAKENILAVCIVPGLLVWIYDGWKEKKQNKLLIAGIILGGALPFFLSPHKEMRILIPFLPFFSCSIASALTRMYDSVSQEIMKRIVALGIFILAGIWVVPQLHQNSYEDNLDFFYEQLQTIPQNTSLWISNPAFIVQTNLKARELLYYPLYDTEKMKEVEKQIPEAEVVLINSCDLLPCPEWDVLCEQEHQHLMSLLEENYSNETSEQQGSCRYYFFKKK